MHGMTRRDLGAVVAGALAAPQTLAQSTRVTGICVVFCDTHTAFINSSVSSTTWWALVTPSSGDLPGGDY